MGQTPKLMKHGTHSRTVDLNAQERGIGHMIDSLNQTPYFKRLKNLSYLGTTGYYPLGKIEIGNLYSLFSVNPVEQIQNSVIIEDLKYILKEN